MEDLSHGFLASSRYIKSLQFMDLGNPLKVIMHYLLIGGMTDLSYKNGVPIVCIVTHQKDL